MELAGCCFALDMPPIWRMETNDGVVIAASDESFSGLTPSVMLWELRLTCPAPTSLAATSQANLAALSTQIPGSFFFHVEAIPDADATPGPAERRRLWAFSTLKIPEAYGNALCLLMIQDLLMVDDVITEVTATVSLMAWHRGSMYESILDSLRSLPLNARRVLHTDSDVFGVDLNDWTSNRDGAPQEKLDIRPDPVPALAGGIATLSEGAFKVLDDLTVFGRSRRTPKFSTAGRELRRAGLIDDPGVLMEAGEWVATHLRNGRHMAVAADSSPPQLLTLWIGDMTVLATSHLTDTTTGRITHRIVHCLTDDIPRLVFMWLELQPSWDMILEITYSQAEFITKLQTGVPPGTVPNGDAAEFTRRRRMAVSLIGPDNEKDVPEVAWAMVRPRGVTLSTEGTNADRVIVSRNLAEPFWQVLTRALLNLAEGEES